MLPCQFLVAIKALPSVHRSGSVDPWTTWMKVHLRHRPELESKTTKHEERMGGELGLHLAKTVKIRMYLAHNPLMHQNAPGHSPDHRTQVKIPHNLMAICMLIDKLHRPRHSKLVTPNKCNSFVHVARFPAAILLMHACVQCIWFACIAHSDQPRRGHRGARHHS